MAPVFSVIVPISLPLAVSMPPPLIPLSITAFFVSVLLSSISVLVSALSHSTIVVVVPPVLIGNTILLRGRGEGVAMITIGADFDWTVDWFVG